MKTGFILAWWHRWRERQEGTNMSAKWSKSWSINGSIRFLLVGRNTRAALPVSLDRNIQKHECNVWTSAESITALTDSTCDCEPVTVYWLGTKTWTELDSLPLPPVWVRSEGNEPTLTAGDKQLVFHCCHRHSQTTSELEIGVQIMWRQRASKTLNWASLLSSSSAWKRVSGVICHLMTALLSLLAPLSSDWKSVDGSDSITLLHLSLQQQRNKPGSCKLLSVCLLACVVDREAQWK